MQTRLNKYLADQGICSRREADKLIESGAVKINGIIIDKLGTKIDPETDKIEVSKKALDQREKEIMVFALYKPTGYVCSTHRTKMEKRIILDLFPGEIVKTKHIYSVGRLDKDTSGLLIVTNDGDLAFRLTHPKFEHSKTYEVETVRPMSPGAMEKISNGVSLFGEKTLPTVIKRISRTKFSLTLKEGKNRQIRRICRKVGAPVKTLKRVQIGKVNLSDLGLSEGDFRLLSDNEIRMLMKN